MRHLIYLSLCAACFSMTACKKDKEEESTIKKDPVFTFSPAENQIFEYGDTVKVNGTISADYDMHGYNVRLYKVTPGMNVLNQGYHVHGNNFVISEAWKNTVSDTTQLRIIIETAIDHEGTIVSSERTVTCYPQ